MIYRGLSSNYFLLRVPSNPPANASNAFFCALVSTYLSEPFIADNIKK